MGKKLEVFIFFILVVVISYGLYNSLSSKSIKHNKSSVTNVTKSKLQFETVYDYTLFVINNGSNKLHLKGGEMEGGYVSTDIAPIVACFVAKELQQKSCPIKYDKRASQYFTSNCGGCHKSNGKGFKDTYPDLTKPLKGFLPKK